MTEPSAAPTPVLEVFVKFWNLLQQNADDFNKIIAVARKAEDAGLDRADMKWLSRLGHEPSLMELIEYKTRKAVA
jgi:hypothetical protein